LPSQPSSRALPRLQDRSALHRNRTPTMTRCSGEAVGILGAVGAAGVEVEALLVDAVL